MTAPCLHVHVKVHGAAAHDLGVVLLPGLGGNGLCFPKPFVAGVLQAVGATMGIAVTYGLPVPRTMDGVAKAVWEALAAAPLGTALPRRVILLGYSMGGFVAQCMAHMASSCLPHGCALAGVVLLSSAFPCQHRLPVPMREVLGSILGSTSRRARASPLGNLFPAHWLATLSPEVIHDLLQLLQQGRASKHVRAAQLHLVSHFLLGPRAHPASDHMRFPVPVLCIHGNKDMVLDVEAVADMVARAPASSIITLTVVPDTGHGLLLQDPHAVFRALVAWNIHHAAEEREVDVVPQQVPVGLRPPSLSVHFFEE